MFDAFENGKNLLIIEIDEAKRKLLSSYFSARYRCDEANSINSALEKIHKKEYSVILTAISLSGLSGLDLIPYLQTLSPRSIPIFISDTEAQGNTVRAFRAGAFEVIQKPFSLKRVEDAISIIWKNSSPNAPPNSTQLSKRSKAPITALSKLSFRHWKHAIRKLTDTRNAS